MIEQTVRAVVTIEQVFLHTHMLRIFSMQPMDQKDLFWSELKMKIHVCSGLRIWRSEHMTISERRKINVNIKTLAWSVI